MSTLPLLSSVAHYNDFDKASVMELSDAAIDAAYTDVAENSLLNGGTNTSELKRDIKEAAISLIEYGVSSADTSHWHFSRDKEYQVKMEKNLRLITYKGQRIYLANDTDKELTVSMLSVGKGGGWVFAGKPITVPPNQVLLR